MITSYSPFLHRVYRTRYTPALTSRCKKGLLRARMGVTAGLGRQCYKILYDTRGSIMGHLSQTYRNILIRYL